MKFFTQGLLITLFLVLQTLNGVSVQKADAVIVIKSKNLLYLVNKGERIASFSVTFGQSPKGHKQKEGDERTPEGHYWLDYKNPNSKFHKSIHVSYPNAQDRANAKRLGVNPGGDIMIHGQTNGWGWAGPFVQFFPWTDGCIALSNKDMDLVWESVDPGTPIEIMP